MTPIEELKKGLDELCIKYTIDDSDDYEVIEWQGPYNLWWQFVYDPYEEASYGELRLLDTGGSTHLAPEQAIEVTVGERSPDGLPIGLTISNDGNLLNWIGENYVRQDTATAGAGTCEADDTDLMPFVRADSDDLNVGYIHVMECSVCGGTYEHVNGSYEFCPRCGRKVMSE